MQNILKNKEQIAAIIFLPILAAILMNQILIALAAISLVLIYSIFEKEKLVPLTIFAFLILTSDVSENLRLGLTFVTITYLLFLYVKEYGLRFDINLISREFLVIFLYLFLVIFVSSFINSVYLSGIWFLIKSTFFLLLFYLYLSLSKNNYKMAKGFLFVLTLSSLILAFTIFYEFYQKGIGLLVSNVLMRYGGIYSNINAAGVLISTAIPVALFFLFIEKNIISKISFSVILFLLSISLLLTNSRSSLVAAFISVIVIIFLMRKKLLKSILIYGSIAIVVLLIFTPIYDLISTLLRFERIVNTRSFIWDIAFNIISNNPIFGVGPGQFPNYIYKYLPVMIGTWDEQAINFVYSEAGLGHAHNFFLFYFSELGFLGFVFTIVFPLIFYKILGRYYKLFKKENLVFELSVCILAIAVFTGALFRGLFESIGIFSYGWIERDLPLWIVIIVFFSIIKRNKTVL